jgi:hypothetical protein
MALEDIGSDIMLDALGVATTFISLHDTFPATTGNEAAGGAPAYARIAAVWDAASGAAMGLDETGMVFDCVGTQVITAIGLASSDVEGAGLIYGGANVTEETFGAQGTYTITALTVSIT